MKKVYILISAIIICALLYGCQHDFPYSGTRPYDYEDAIWVCEDPPAYFIVDHSDKEYFEPKGKITLDGQELKFKFSFVNGTNIILINDLVPGEEYGLYGNCDFSPDKLVIKINKKVKDTIFNHTRDELIFVRTTEPIE